MRDAWVVVPFVDLWTMTRQAAEDALAQDGVKTRVLLVANDCTDESLRVAERWVKEQGERVLLWNHRPALPALGATWNRALEFCWEAGATHALVVNNDTRLKPKTYSLLHTAMKAKEALFVSAVGVREEQFALEYPDITFNNFKDKGGPDYSCFLITVDCHDRFPFDSEMTYAGDCDHHRRIMLAGEGDRIFSVNVPYLHYASGTLKGLSPEKAQVYHAQADAHRAYYQKKWGGGGVNAETYREPFSGVDEEGITTSQLFDRVRAGW